MEEQDVPTSRLLAQKRTHGIVLKQSLINALRENLYRRKQQRREKNLLCETIEAVKK